MRFLYFDELPRAVEKLKDNSSGAFFISGAMVYLSEVLEALLDYCTYDRIFLPARQRAESAFRETRAFAENADRIQFLAEHELPQLRTASHLVMASGGPDLVALNRKRRIVGRDQTPLTGVIHSINLTSHHFAGMLGFFMAPLREFDALICSSSAGFEAVWKFRDVMRGRLRQAGLASHYSAWKTPIIPLGVNIDSLSDVVCSELRERLGLEHKLVILYFGRFSAASKADLCPLIIAFSQLRKRHPLTALVLAGDDTQYRMARGLEALASDLGCAECVRIIPNPTAAEKREIYGLGDVFVSLADSLQETFGITLVEAMAAGLPVVASDWNGYKDIVVPGETGYLVPTYFPDCSERFDDIRGSGSTDQPDLLAASTVVDLAILEQALDRLLSDPDRRAAFGKAGRARARALYDWPAVVRRYEDLWDELAEEASACVSQNMDTGLTFDRWGYREVFGHYSTALLDANMRVRISGLGKRPQERAALLERAASPNSWFDQMQLATMLQILQESSGMSIGELLSATYGSFEDVGMSHACRLLKYGLISRVG